VSKKPAPAPAKGQTTAKDQKPAAKGKPQPKKGK
jgi:hypothetical protein